MTNREVHLIVLTKMNCCLKSSIQECAPNSRVHVQVLHCGPRTLVRRFFLRSRRLHPCEALWLEICVDCVAIIFFQLWDFQSFQICWVVMQRLVPAIQKTPRKADVPLLQYSDTTVDVAVAKQRREGTTETARRLHDKVQ